MRFLVRSDRTLLHEADNGSSLGYLSESHYIYIHTYQVKYIKKLSSPLHLAKHLKNVTTVDPE